ncbi:MAG TPA: hypothetical protein VF456_04415 [Vicinamibacterales bacterium]
MTSRLTMLVASAVLLVSAHARGANSASGSVDVQKVGSISPKFSAAYLVRDQRNARTTQTEILLSEVTIDPAQMEGVLDPHLVAINLDALRNRNYILIFVRADGSVGMNATFSKGTTQFLNDTTGGLKAELTARTATRIEGHVFSPAPLKSMDGTTYTVDLRFGVDVAVPPVGTALPAGGGEPGKALAAFLAASQKKNWTTIKAGSSPEALKTFDKSYNSPAENAESASDLLKIWIPLQKMTITGGQLRGKVAVLDVEGELFPNQRGLSLVQMVKTGAVWRFDRAARAGLVR